MRKTFLPTLLLLISISGAVVQAEPMATSETLKLGYIIDLNNTGLNFASSIAVDQTTSKLYLGISNSGMAELSPEGQLLNTFPIPVTRVDNSGLSFNPSTGTLLFVNGWGDTSSETIIEMTPSGTVITETNSPIVEGTGLAIDPLSGNLFVSDVINTSSHLIKELQMEEGEYVVVNSFALPGILAYADAGLDFNPITGNLAVSGAFGQNPGVIFDVSRDGSVVEAYLDTGLPNGVTGLAFDDEPFRLYVLDGYGKQILVYGDFQKIYLPFVVTP